MDDETMRASILAHLANQVGRSAAEVARVTDAVYGMDEPVIRENLEQLRAVERSLRALARAMPAPDHDHAEARPLVAEAALEL